MKKCYIAGFIGDLPKSEYETNFLIAKREVEKLGYQPVSPTEMLHDHGHTWCEYLKEDLTEMLKCDAVYALRNWRKSPGATLEINLALNLGINIIHQI